MTTLSFCITATSIAYQYAVHPAVNGSQSIVPARRKPAASMRRNTCSGSTGPASLANEIKIVKRAKDDDMFVQEERKERIRQTLRKKVELSVSSYDTAWVAMVPSQGSPQSPCFPDCINWILENQHPDGSWGLLSRPPYLLKDALSSTLACILALKRWNIGEEHVKRGLHFIGSNFPFATDDKEQHTPIGFNIIFPGMMDYARGLDLNLPISQAHTAAMLGKREAELKSINGKDSVGTNAYLAYIAEGLGKLQDWEKIMKYQRKNGSLFNSPATTAAALSHVWDANAHQYLISLLQEFGHAVPTVYPQDIYTNLRMVDNLERLGIAHHFRDDIKAILDNAYRYWLLDDDQISMDIAISAMAFRLLRMNGYKVSAGKLAELNEDDVLSHSLDGWMKDVSTVHELYKASQIKLLSNEEGLDKLNSWTINFLKQAKANNLMRKGQQQVNPKELDYAITFPFYSNVNCVKHRRSIEQYNLDNLQTLKTSYTYQNIDNKDVQELAVSDFNLCQDIYKKELELLERWVKETAMDKLEFARNNMTYCYFSSVAANFHPEAFDFRISFGMNAMLSVVIDDFFDVGSTREEQLQLIELVRKWNGIGELNCYSKGVQTIFFALYSAINYFGANPSIFKNKGGIIDHRIEVWLDMMECMLIEADSMRDKEVPTMDKYLQTGYVSIAAGNTLMPALYFLEPELSTDIVHGDEFKRLFKLMGTSGRLLNDAQTVERERNHGKLNGVSLYMLHHGCSEQEAKRVISLTIDTCRAELLGLVLQNEGSVVPRSCKDAIWNTYIMLHRMYTRSDGFTSPEDLASSVKAVLKEPLRVPYE